jgi:hypothetical protein
VTPSAPVSPLQAKTELRRRLRERQRTAGYTLYRTDPVGFISDILDEQPWSIQRSIADALLDHRYVAVPSCFGSGKDWIAARIGAWWVATGGILVVTSNTFSQLRDVYWRELRKAHAKGGLPGQPTWGTDLRWDFGEGSWAIGRKPDDNDPEGLQGIHGERVLVIVDEANGVSPQLWEATRGLVVNAASESSRSATRGSRRVPSTRPANRPTGTSSRSRSSTPRTSRVSPCRPRRRPSSSAPMARRREGRRPRGHGLVAGQGARPVPRHGVRPGHPAQPRGDGPCERPYA